MSKTAVITEKRERERDETEQQDNDISRRGHRKEGRS